MISKIIEIIKKFTIELNWKERVLVGSCIALVLGAVIICSVLPQNKDTEVIDKNVYLKEEICYADEVYISVQSINVIESTETDLLDEDGDELSKYILNLGLRIEQRNIDSHVNKVKISPSNFELKSVNINARSKMGVFFECLAKETLSAMLGGALDGSINIIEETINYAADYTLSSIENAENSKVDFKPIKCSTDSFSPFYPYEQEEATYIEISFPIKKEYLESNNIIVLAIDSWTHIEKRIFLIVRPNSNK